MTFILPLAEVGTTARESHWRLPSFKGKAALIVVSFCTNALSLVTPQIKITLSSPLSCVASEM